MRLPLELRSERGRRCARLLLKTAQAWKGALNYRRATCRYPKPGMAARQHGWPGCLTVLAIQSIAASAIIATIQRAFRRMADNVEVLNRIPVAATRCPRQTREEPAAPSQSVVRIPTW